MSVKQYGWLVKTLRDETGAELQVALKRTWTLKFGYGMHAEAFAEDPVLGPIRGRGFSKKNKFEALTNAITDWSIVIMEKAIRNFTPEDVAALMAAHDACECGSNGEGPSDSHGPQGPTGGPGISADELKATTAEKTGEKLAEPEE